MRFSLAARKLIDKRLHRKLRVFQVPDPAQSGKDDLLAGASKRAMQCFHRQGVIAPSPQDGKEDDLGLGVLALGYLGADLLANIG